MCCTAKTCSLQSVISTTCTYFSHLFHRNIVIDYHYKGIPCNPLSFVRTLSKRLSLITCVLRGPTKTCSFFVQVCAQKRLQCVLQPFTYSRAADKKTISPCGVSRGESSDFADVVPEKLFFPTRYKK
jgi:hypothetical protein